MAIHEEVRRHGSVEPIRYVERLTTTIVHSLRREERRHEEPNGNYAHGSSRCHIHIEAAAFHDLLPGRNCHRDGRLAVRARLGHGFSCEMAVCLIQVFDELNDLGCRAADHNPERKVYLQRDRHGASPSF